MHQISFFIDPFMLALHVLGNNFAHLQEHFDCIYSFLEQCTDSRKLYIQSKCSLRRAKLSPKTCKASIKGSIKNEICCILLVTYITVQVMHGHMNIKLKQVRIMCSTKTEICEVGTAGTSWPGSWHIPHTYHDDVTRQAKRQSLVRGRERTHHASHRCQQVSVSRC
jgi:hypothetical protein